MKWPLVLFCVGVLVCMTIITTVASLDRSVLAAGEALWPDPWFLATLMDAYFGFLTFYLWVAYKETGWFSRISWLIAILFLGNFAMSAYLLRQLWKIKDFSFERLLLRQPAEVRE